MKKKCSLPRNHVKEGPNLLGEEAEGGAVGGSLMSLYWEMTFQHWILLAWYFNMNMFKLKDSEK